MKSLVYWHPLIYTMLIRLSYGRVYLQRYQAIADLVDKRSSVVDVCCGDCTIYSFLKEKDVDYLGLDFNPCFVDKANKKGIKARLFDIRKDALPKADYILLQGSLYQFHPDEAGIIGKLLAAAKRQLILSEPVKNRAASPSKPIAWLSEKLSDPGDGVKKFKFDEQSLRRVMAPFQQNIINEFMAANNIDSVFVLSKEHKG